jgi:aminoglycoside 6'-N-acetyltransferase
MRSLRRIASQRERVGVRGKGWSFDCVMLRWRDDYRLHLTPLFKKGFHMKSASIKFKPLVEGDLPLLHAWFQKPHIKQWYARGENYSLEMIKEKYTPRILNPQSIPNFIIYASNKPIGYIQLYRMSSNSLPDGVDNLKHPLFSRYKPEEIAGMDLFIADEEFLGKGYGSLILNAFIEEQVEGRFIALVVDPLRTNRNAIRFFEAYGFKEFSQSKIESNNALMVLEVVRRSH